MDYILRYSLTSGDVDFINNSSIDIEIYNPGVTGNDSGWCDMDTGQRLLMHSDRVIFHNVSEPDLLMLKLKFGNRLKELHDGMKSIYNIDREEK
jgi:hypothetical protein